MWGFLHSVRNVSWWLTQLISFLLYSQFFFGDPVFMIHWWNKSFIKHALVSPFKVLMARTLNGSWCSSSMCSARGWIAGKLFFSFYPFEWDWEFQSSSKWKDGHGMTLVENDDCWLGMTQWIEWICILGLRKLSNWVGLNQSVKDNWSPLQLIQWFHDLSLSLSLSLPPSPSPSPSLSLPPSLRIRFVFFILIRILPFLKKDLAPDPRSFFKNFLIKIIFSRLSTTDKK